MTLIKLKILCGLTTLTITSDPLLSRRQRLLPHFSAQLAFFPLLTIMSAETVAHHIFDISARVVSNHLGATLLLILLFPSFVELTLGFLFLAHMYVVDIASFLAPKKTAFIDSYFTILSIGHLNGKKTLCASMHKQAHAPVQRLH